MYILRFTFFTLFFTLLLSCKSEPTLQQYMAKNTENSDFLALDFGPEVLEIADNQLSTEEHEALKSLKKINLLLFKKKSDNQERYTLRKQEVSQLLKNDNHYQELIRYGSNDNNLAIYLLGDTDRYDEFVIFGNNSDIGFVIARILGKDMSSNQIMNIVTLLQKSNINKKHTQVMADFFKHQQN